MTKIQLVGFDKFSYNVKDKVNSVVKRLLDKYNRIFMESTLKIFKLSVSKKRERKDHTLFEIKGYLETTYGLFYATCSDWDVLDAIERVVEDLTRQMIEKKEKLKIAKK